MHRGREGEISQQKPNHPPLCRPLFVSADVTLLILALINIMNRNFHRMSFNHSKYLTTFMSYDDCKLLFALRILESDSFANEALHMSNF